LKNLSHYKPKTTKTGVDIMKVELTGFRSKYSCNQDFSPLPSSLEGSSSL